MNAGICQINAVIFIFGLWPLEFMQGMLSDKMAALMLLTQ